MTDFRSLRVPPFLSIAGLRGQLKSPPMTIFSSESRFSFFNVLRSILKNSIRSLSLFGAYTLINRYAVSSISAFRIIYRPMGPKNV